MQEKKPEKMSSTRTKRSLSRGTVKSSTTAAPPCKKTAKKTSARNVKKISKYFASTKKDDDLENSDELSDSPYKNCITQVKSAKLDNSASDLDDFKTPKAINKVSKIVSKPVEQKAKKKKTRQVPIRKFVEDNLKYSDVHPEHLQMALALSESSYQEENPNATPSSQEKKESFKLAFEKFGFGYSRNRVTVENKRDLADCKRMHKKSRYRFVTPILKMRTSEEREVLISSKVSLILAQNNRKATENNLREPQELFCESLRNCRRRKIFKINCSDLGELKDDTFYVQGLGVDFNRVSCGCLLRDWRRIPGRELSPGPELTPPTSQSPPLRAESPCLENSSPTSKKGQSSSSAIELTCGEMIVFDNSSNCNENSTEERLRPEIGSPFVERRPPIFNHPNIVQLDNNGESAAENSSKRITSSNERTDTPECVIIESESEEYERMSKYRLSPEETCLLGKISPCYEPPSRDFTTCCDTPKCGENLLTSPLKIEASPTLNSWTSPAINSPCLGTPKSNSRNNATITLPQRNKRPHDCLSPDLFDSDDEQPPNRLRGGQDLNPDEIECYDLTQSDNEEEESFHLKLSDTEHSIGRRSDLNVTEYVQDLLSNYKEEAPPIKKLEKISTSEDDESQQSQSSVYISDDELNYSSVFSTPHHRKKVEYDLSEDEQFGLSLAERIKNKEELDLGTPQLPPPEISVNQKHLPMSPLTNHFTDNTSRTPNRPAHLITTPVREDSFNNLSHISLNDTPSTSFVIETKNVTPMDVSVIQKHPLRPPLTNLCADNISHTPNRPVHSVTTPTLEDSFNEVLDHISPIDTPSTSNAAFVIKTKNVTPMANYDEMDTPKLAKELDKYGLKPLKRQKGAKLLKYIYESTHPVVGDENHTAKKRRTHHPKYGGVIGNVGEEGEVILEKKQSKKVAGCAVPLHIVWHNFVMSNPKIMDNILLYEPLQLEVLHSMLKDQGFKFNIQDLLAFLDKKCITIRTAQGQHHGKKPR